MLSPSRTKWRKHQKGSMRGVASTGCSVDFGDFGIVATQCGWVTARQIEAGRIAISRHLKKMGKLWIRLYPDKPLTKKPVETRMGKGKGNVEEWICVVKPGRILYEVRGVPEDEAREALRRASRKMPVLTKFVTRDSLL